MLHEALAWQTMSFITNKGTNAIISKLANKAKVYEQGFDMLFQIKQV